MDEASLSISPSFSGQLVKMLTTLVWIKLCIHCPATGMHKADEASPSISLASRGQIVNMLVTLEPHGIFQPNCAYLYFLTLSGHWYAKRGRNRRIPPPPPPSHLILEQPLLIPIDQGYTRQIPIRCLYSMC